MPVDQPTDPIEAEHLIERVVHRAQIGIDLLRHIAGQKTEALAGFDCRPHQYQAADRLFSQSFHSRSHGQIGLAGTGGPNAEGQIGIAHRPRIGNLIGTARTDVPAFCANDHATLRILPIGDSRNCQVNLLRIQLL